MKRSLIFILFAIITTASHAGWHIYDKEGCALESRFLKKDSYYFCGAHEIRCNNDWAEDVEIKNGYVKWFQNGEFQSLNNEIYWCCDGKITSSTANLKKKDKVSGTAGKWVKGENFYITRETKTKNISGGTCTYVETTDICGNVTTTEQECKTQAAANVQCPDGQYFRTSSNSCAKLCDVGYAYESSTSNRCVECEETAYQGIVSDTGVYVNGDAVDPTHAVCRRCNTATSIFDAATRTCVGKPQLTALSITDLQYGKNAHSRNKSLSEQCWTMSADEYKKCVLGK